MPFTMTVFASLARLHTLHRICISSVRDTIQKYLADPTFEKAVAGSVFADFVLQSSAISGFPESPTPPAQALPPSGALPIATAKAQSSQPPPKQVTQVDSKKRPASILESDDDNNDGEDLGGTRMSIAETLTPIHAVPIAREEAALSKVFLKEKKKSLFTINYTPLKYYAPLHRGGGADIFSEFF